MIGGREGEEEDEVIGTMGVDANARHDDEVVMCKRSELV